MIVDRARVAAVVPNYVLGEQLGAGAFGLVLRAEHRRIRRPAAIKVMPAQTAEGERIDSPPRHGCWAGSIIHMWSGSTTTSRPTTCAWW